MVISQNPSHYKDRNLVKPSSGKEKRKGEGEGEKEGRRGEERDGFIKRNFYCTIIKDCFLFMSHSGCGCAPSIFSFWDLGISYLNLAEEGKKINI